jgi:diketogulonate reductase-like aldo/keto reductase
VIPLVPLQIHWPFQVKKGTEISPENFVQPDIPKTWQAMEQLYDSGKARAIGVSNFSSKKLGDLLGVARVPPAVDQVECHLGWQQEKLRAFCRSNGVHLSVSLHAFLRSITWLVTLGVLWSRAFDRQAYAPLGRMKDVASNPVVSSIAESLGKTPAQIALRWGLQQGQSVLPKSANASRLKENIDLFDWSIPEELCAKLSEINQASTQHLS